jgi:hypothetical protein
MLFEAKKADTASIHSRTLKLCKIASSLVAGIKQSSELVPKAFPRNSGLTAGGDEKSSKLSYGSYRFTSRPEIERNNSLAGG